MKVEVVVLERMCASRADTKAALKMEMGTMEMEMIQLSEKEEEEEEVVLVYVVMQHVNGKMLGKALGGILVLLVHVQIGTYVPKDIRPPAPIGGKVRSCNAQDPL